MTTTYFLDKKLKIVLFYNSKQEFVFLLVTLSIKRFSSVKLSLNSQGWLSFATQAASSENKTERKKAVNGVWGRCISKTTEVSGYEFKYIWFFFYRSLNSLFLFFYYWNSDKGPKQIAFVTIRVDYCNNLFCGLPKYQVSKSQRVLNASARLINCAPKSCHITLLLGELHGLPVCYHIE